MNDTPPSLPHYDRPPQSHPPSDASDRARASYLQRVESKGCPIYNPKNLQLASEACLILGLLSIIASVATWFAASKKDDAYGERFGIFIGLWVPSFFILSNRLSRKADELG